MAFPATRSRELVSAWPEWLTDPTSVRFLHAADFWIGVIGFVITVATFALGWRKLTKVQASAAAAEAAVKEVKLRVGRYDATVDASEGMHLCHEITRHLETADWRAVVQSMTAVRFSIIRMNAQVSAINDGLGRELRRSAQRLDKHIVFIEEAVSTGTALPDDHVVRQSIRLCQEAFVKAKRNLEDQIA